METEEISESENTIKFEESKLLYKLEKEVEELQQLDQRIRVHGKNIKIERVISYIKKLKTLLIGGGCEFYELGWCEVLNRKCIIADKIKCKTRLDELNKLHPQVGSQKQRRPKKTKIKHKDYEFQKIVE